MTLFSTYRFNIKFINSLKYFANRFSTIDSKIRFQHINPYSLSYTMLYYVFWILLCYKICEKYILLMKRLS